MHSLIYLFILIPLLSAISAKVDVCGNANIKGHGVDLSAIDGTTWSLTKTKANNSQRVDYSISICSPLKISDDKRCDNSYICRHNTTDNSFIGYEPKSIEVESMSGSKTQSVVVLYEGPPCDHILNYTIKIRFSCGPHLEYPQHFMDTKCSTDLFWRTYAVCKEKPIYNEVKCYVYDDNGYRRDLTPLIKPKGGSYKVLSQDQDFYINVCSNVSGHCTEENTGACLKTGENKYRKVGDYQYNTIDFKSKSGVVPYDHIEMTYKTKSGEVCRKNEDFTSVTTIRFICPQKEQKRSIDFLDRNPKLVSNLDCDYQIEWLTEYACPLNRIEVSPTKCELTEEIQGIDFNLKSLFKGENSNYRIHNITINGTNGPSLYEIAFNVCGGLGRDYKCGGKEWESNAVCLKSEDNPSYSKVIGSTSDGSLRLVDNRFFLEYRTKSQDCKLGDNSMSETTLIEFICDDTKGFEYLGKPEFVSFDDCTYYIIWKTSMVCPVISANTSCVTSYKNLTFDLSLLRKGFNDDSWTASVNPTLPWSRHSKDKNDNIFINVCGVVNKKSDSKTKWCDGRSSACMTIGDSKTSISLGHFQSAPQYNEDIKAIELIYENGLDHRNHKKIKSKIILRCRPGAYNSEPTLVDVDEETGTYHFEWDTWAACPINSFVGSNCSVFDSFLEHTFNLSGLHSNTPYLIKVDGYEFQISVCGQLNTNVCNADKIKTAVGPFGVCQTETKGENRSFSLGKASTELTYWNGVINMTFIDGTPYNDVDKTPRKSHIAFICDPNAGNGHPEYDGERNRSYFFRWYTSLACPHTSKTIHCVWDNGTHVLDLTPLAMTTGNHFTVGLPTGQSTVPSIYYINICRPLNPIHDNPSSIDECGADSAACRITLDSNHTTLSLGKAIGPPIYAFDGVLSLLYHDGSTCPTNHKKNISTRIKFECDPHSDLSNPTVHEPGSELTDSEECVYLFEWRTSAVCDVIKPAKMDTDSCVFTDNITKLSVDLSPLRKLPSEQPYQIPVRSGQSTYELNVCGPSNAQPSDQCSNSAVCYRSNSGSQSSQTSVNYGLLSSGSFFFDGTDLRLRHYNGTKCMAHNTTQMMSSEIIFKCNPEAKHSAPKLHSSHACVVVFDWETNLVCNLRPQKCSIVANNQFYNLRQLSSLSHAWNTTDKEGNVYYLNVCTKLPTEIKCKDPNAASCKCTHDSNKQLDCSESLGEPSAQELQFISNGTLQLTYKNGGDEHCPPDMTAQTQIVFKCGKSVGAPKFIEFVSQKCVYKFEWNSMIACPVTDNNDVLLPEQNGYLHDQRLDVFINVGPLLNKNFTVEEQRTIKDEQKGETIDKYDYVINLSSPPLSTTSECSKAAVCQTKSDHSFVRDIGTMDSIKYYLRGHELQIVLKGKKCGRNQNKNVTTIFRLQCSLRSGIGNPVFMYESNDCDYTFNWETSQVCPMNFMDKDGYETIAKDFTTTTPSESPSAEEVVPPVSEPGSSKVWIGVVIVVFFVLTLTLLFGYKKRYRQSLMFRFRRMFGPEPNDHTFHYHQLASNEKDRPREEVVFISGNGAQNRNTIAAQPSGPVPYCSIYDDSDVDLLT